MRFCVVHELRMNRIRHVIACSLMALAPGALAARLEIPLRVPLEPVRDALAARLAASPSTPNQIYREGRCRYLNLDAPKLEGLEGASCA